MTAAPSSVCFPGFTPIVGAWKCLFKVDNFVTFSDAENDCKNRTNQTGGIYEMRDNESWSYVKTLLTTVSSIHFGLFHLDRVDLDRVHLDR